MAKNGFEERNGELLLFVNDEHILTVRENGIFLVGSKTLAAKTLKGSGGNDVAVGVKVSKIVDPAAGTNIDTKSRTAIEALIDGLEAYGISAA